MNTQVTSAKETAEFYRNDPELALAIPSHPRLIPEVKFLPFRDADLLCVGGYSIQVFKGNGAKNILTHLQPYFDGNHSLQDIEDAVPANIRPKVFEIMTLFSNKGLLEDAPANKAACPDTPLASYIGRFSSSGRNFRSREESLAHIANTHLAVLAPEAYHTAIEMLFSELPVASLNCGVSPDAFEDREHTLYLVIEGPGLVYDQSYYDALSHQDSAVFYASIFNDSVSIGPLTSGKQGTSYDSFASRVAPSNQTEADGPEVLFWLGNLYHEFVNYLAKISLQTVFNVCKHYHISDNELEGNTVKTPPMPGHLDSNLSHVRFLQSQQAEDLWELHNNIRMPPKTYIGDGFHLHHYKKSNRNLTMTGKPKFHSAITYALPTARKLPATALFDTQSRLGLQDLADLLVFSYGFQHTPNGPRLIPPTGGGLSSPESYLVITDVDDIPEGIYHYDSVGHALEFIGDVNTTLYASLLNEERLPQCLLLGVASLARVRSKYGDSAFKVTNLDAGVAQTYIRTLSTRLGVALTDYVDWNGLGLMESAGIAFRENRFVLTHVFGLGDTQPLAMHHDEMVNHFIAPRCKIAKQNWQDSDCRNAIKHRQDLQKIMIERRAVRDFEPTAISIKQVDKLLGMSTQLSRRLNAANELAIPLNYWIVNRYDSEDSKAGLYLFDQQSGRAKPVYLQSDIDFTRFANQTSLTDASILILVTSDLDEVLNEHQAYGYKTMWQHAGQVFGDLWLNACADGFVGTIAGGALDDGLMAYGETDGYTNAVLGLFCFGYHKEES